MKRTKLFIIAIITIATLGVSFVGVAQKEKKNKREEARTEIQAYMKTNVLPVILEKRKEFDSQLSNSEKKKLVALRSRMDALKKERETMQRPEGEPSDEQKKKHYEMEKEMRHITTAAWEIADKHESDLLAVKTSTESQKQQWESDIKAIMEKYSPNKEKREKSHGEHKRKFKTGQQIFQHNKPVMFLLMDPNKTVDEIAVDMEKRQMTRKMKFKGHRGNHDKKLHEHHNQD